MNTIKYPLRSEWPELLKRPSIDVMSLEIIVAPILSDVKENGDAALKRYTLQFDGILLQDFIVGEKEKAKAEKSISPELKNAILLAKSNIEKFHSAQKEEIKTIETMPGVKCWRKTTAIEKIGLYIPGGTAPLFSTVLMLAIPAQLAGCREIILCTPPDKNGEVNPAIIFAAGICGISTVFKIGGAQAIAAMAYGTETVPRVYKLFGPGNQYVTCAKQLVNSSGIAIDMPAGPSELAVFADDTSLPAFVAADLLSQAEHGKDSQVILVSDNEDIIEKIQSELTVQMQSLPRIEIVREALANSKAFLVEDQNEAICLLNEYAPEHLIIASEKADMLAEKVINAGSVFLGNYSCESAGDYASGTNHTLPTNGWAKAYSGVSLDSFVKKITFQKITAQGLTVIGSTIEIMAEAEGLLAHKNAVSIRLKK